MNLLSIYHELIIVLKASKHGLRVSEELVECRGSLVFAVEVSTKCF